MRNRSVFRFAAQAWLVVAASSCLWGQANPAGREAHGLPVRATPVDYQAQGVTGDYTIAADFTGHAIPNELDPLHAEDHIAVEVAIFGPPDARLMIQAAHFSLRVNGRKEVLPAQPWPLVAKSIKDPNWVPEEGLGQGKSKGGISGSGGDRQPGEPPPPPPKPPFELFRSWQQRVGKAAIAEGERPLPQAGLIFFPYRGKTENIRSLELIYQGPAGKATLVLR